MADSSNRIHKSFRSQVDVVRRRGLEPLCPEPPLSPKEGVEETASRFPPCQSGAVPSADSCPTEHSSTARLPGAPGCEAASEPPREQGGYRCPSCGDVYPGKGAANACAESHTAPSILLGAPGPVVHEDDDEDGEPPWDEEEEEREPLVAVSATLRVPWFESEPEPVARPAWTSALAPLGLAPELQTFLLAFPSFEDAWRACPRADWMLLLWSRSTWWRGDPWMRALCTYAARLLAIAGAACLEVNDNEGAERVAWLLGHVEQFVDRAGTWRSAERWQRECLGLETAADHETKASLEAIGRDPLGPLSVNTARAARVRLHAVRASALMAAARLAEACASVVELSPEALGRSLAGVAWNAAGAEAWATVEVIGEAQHDGRRLAALARWAERRIRAQWTGPRIAPKEPEDFAERLGLRRVTELDAWREIGWPSVDAIVFLESGVGKGDPVKALSERLHGIDPRNVKRVPATSGAKNGGAK